MHTKLGIVLILFFLFCFTLYADDNEPGENAKKNVAQLTIKTGGALGVYEPWITGNVEFSYLFWGWLGVGAEAGIHSGLTYQDLHSTGYLFLKLGGFYIGGGVSLEMADSMLPADSEYDTFSTIEMFHPAVTMGLLIPIIQLGPGKLGVNLSLDWFVTDIPIYYLEQEEDESIIAYIIKQIVSGLGQTVAGVIASGKLGVELSYTFAF